MADEMDRFFTLLQEQGRVLSKQGESLATIAQTQKDTHGRLFGENGQPGIIQYLVNKDTALEADIKLANASCATLSADRRVDKAYVMGATAVITLGAKWLLGKVGLHF